MAVDLDEVIRQGAQRYFTDKGVYRNPHPAGSDEFNAFERGWMQSLKKNDGRLVDSLSPGPPSDKRRNTPKNDVETQAERYRSRKG